MNLPDKIIKHRKSNGWSQEEFAEKLNVSRQAVSRWENGSALPDAQNILQISRLFDVTTDYLLNDDYESDKDIPCIKKANNVIDTQKRNYTRLSVIASIAFAISAVIWLFLAISTLEIVYVVLTIACAVLSAIYIIIYETNTKNKNPPA